MVRRVKLVVCLVACLVAYLVACSVARLMDCSVLDLGGS